MRRSAKKQPSIGKRTARQRESGKPFLFVVLALISAAAVILTATRTAYAESASPGEQTTVYVTSTGARYHREDCNSLRRSKIAVTLADAVRAGYEPCSICEPPVLTGSHTSGTAASALPETAGPPLYRVNQALDPASGAEGLKSYTAADISRMVKAEVVDHVDGDTIRVRIFSNAGAAPMELGLVETIRLLGVDTPETVHPSRPVERFGEEASNFTKARLLNTQVYLVFDWDLRDRYGRLLAYIYTTRGECFNALLIREGYAHAYSRFTFQFMDEFRALEQEARREKRGLWRD
jgi:micrococcal nuclease